MARLAGIVLVGLLLSWTTTVRAIAPPYLSDEELADSPIIVVAQWENAPFKSHVQYDQNEQLGRVVKQSEAYTTLKVLRTVKGNGVSAGKHELLVGFGIAWRHDGKWVTSGTSTELPGDVKDTTQPNLWFLKKTRSWDESRKNEYLTVDNYRQIQPPALEKYFVALGSPDRETLVPKLLAPDQPEVTMRILRYISGGIWPWPYDPDRFELRLRYFNPEHRGRVLKGEATRVWAIVKSNGAKSRPYAASVYADLKGRDCIVDIRTLLDDKDPVVRGVAIGVLARHHDAASVGDMQKAIQGVNDGSLGCKLVEAFASWGDERVVPCLISCLQKSTLAYLIGDDVGIPALKARQALKEITGHWFPLDVARSMKAWRQVQHIPDKVKRRELLNKLIPGEESPFVAELVGSPSYPSANADRESHSKSLVEAVESGEVGREQAATATVRLRNTSKESIIIAKQPSDVEMTCAGGCSNYGDYLSVKKVPASHFVTVAPGGVLEFQVKLWSGFLVAEPSARHLKVSFWNNGNDVGVNAWIGTLEVKPAADWSEQRKTEKVEENWPNGNLKVTGTTVNGHKVGEWNYFNERGDRIRIENYGNGKGTAECNPDHPDNKGAGKRRK
jgi:hypothetical protein